MSLQSRKYPRSQNGLQSVYVARTVQERQKPLERFLGRAGRHLGPTAMIYALDSTHLTILESKGVMNRFRELGYTRADMRVLRGELDGHLKGKVTVADSAVTVDTDHPLRWMPGNKLALGIIPNDHLQAMRDQTEVFLEEKFGSLPDMSEFVPHVTIGKVMRKLSPGEREDPREVLPDDLHIPSAIALNGLEVYLDVIQ